MRGIKAFSNALEVSIHGFVFTSISQILKSESIRKS